jgi:hypothetical protein
MNNREVSMADDPTVRMSPRQPRECPTCGKEPLPEEIVCSVCGTNLQQAVPEPTVVVPPPSPPPSASLLPPAPLPPQEDVLKRTRPVQQSVRAQTLSFSKWIGLTGGALAFILLSFFAGKLSVQPEGTLRLPEERGTKDEVPQNPPETLPMRGPKEPPPPPQLLGQVTTADELMPIHVFGTGTNDEARTVTAFRNQVERLLSTIQSTYKEMLARHPQLFGAVVLELKVTQEGRVSEAKVHATGIDDTQFLRMIPLLVKEWQFGPAQAGEVRIFGSSPNRVGKKAGLMVRKEALDEG